MIDDSIMFTLVPGFIGLVFVLLIGTILYNMVTGIAEWSHNNAQPVLKVNSRVVAKRTTMNGHAGHHSHRRISTSHFVTFELDSGERLEFPVHGSDFGMLVEGDSGILTYQGTRFKEFSRRL